LGCEKVTLDRLLRDQKQESARLRFKAFRWAAIRAARRKLREMWQLRTDRGLGFWRDLFAADDVDVDVIHALAALERS
jgi:hypothetical protein